MKILDSLSQLVPEFSWIHVFSVKQNSGTENFQTENCMENSGGLKGSNQRAP